MTKSLNNNLHKAKAGKNDEFYTQLDDIAKELRYYKDHFKDKVVFCNCDDPRISNFFHYFSHYFKELGLKKLITTCYKNINPDLFSQHLEEKAVYIEYNGEMIDNIPDYARSHVKYLQGDGDFRSKECVELLKQVDIVVTNPPFSLFREYVAQLIEYDKKFLIIGSMNAITYKEIFKFIKQNKIWLGMNAPKDFLQPDNEVKTFGNINWFTNLENRKRNEELILYKTYYGNETNYPTYDNYNAIEVSKIAHIPMDYKGNMGVPITFIDKYNPEQFELIGMGEDNGTGYSGGIWLGGSKSCLYNGKAAFKRLFIKHKKI
ncbi:MAG: Modification methylase EcoRI [Pseudomonadota bacterium]|jgi:hypothetical protein